MPISHWKLVLLVPVASLLTACGGGGSPGDGTVPLEVKPGEITISDATSGCPGFVRGVDVMVTGGNSPYTIHNPIPQAIALTTSRVDRAGQSFHFDALGGCLDNIPLTVTDADANSVDFVINRTYAQ